MDVFIDEILQHARGGVDQLDEGVDGLSVPIPPRRSDRSITLFRRTLQSDAARSRRAASRRPCRRPRNEPAVAKPHLKRLPYAKNTLCPAHDKPCPAFVHQLKLDFLRMSSIVMLRWQVLPRISSRHQNVPGNRPHPPNPVEFLNCRKPYFSVDYQRTKYQIV